MRRAAAGVVKSTDGGTTWSQRPTIWASELAVDPAETPAQYTAGTGAEFSKSTDGGAKLERNLDRRELEQQVAYYHGHRRAEPEHALCRDAGVR